VVAPSGRVNAGPARGRRTSWYSRTSWRAASGSATRKVTRAADTSGPGWAAAGWVMAGA